MDAQLAFFSPAEGVHLYYEWWMPERPKAVVVVVHGMGDHSGRYGPLIRYFGQRQYGVAIYDQRGHGHSGGPRGHVEHFQDLLGDLAYFVQMLKEHYPGVPLYLVGHGFGGQVALNFVVRYAKGLRGLLLSSPNVQLALKVPKWKQWVGRYGHRWFPRIALRHAVDSAMLSHDPDVVERHRRDPLVVRRVSLHGAVEIVRNLELVMALASRIHLPVFFMHAGADAICDPEGTRRFFRRIPVARKQLKIYDEFAHELFNEVRRDEVFRDMEQWMSELLIEERLAREPKRPEQRITVPAGLQREKPWAHA
ncbi:MAG: lysophospholipase [Deltaproteobacteria bacterium]|nr:lysophospholipase [Deltaproteobacteria bacterium]